MYKIINPYESVMSLIEDQERHYKTNLHTHSTYSDANDTMTDMIIGFYDNDFDILAFAEHGIFKRILLAAVLIKTDGQDAVQLRSVKAV